MEAKKKWKKDMFHASSNRNKFIQFEEEPNEQNKIIKKLLIFLAAKIKMYKAMMRLTGIMFPHFVVCLLNTRAHTFSFTHVIYNIQIYVPLHLYTRTHSHTHTNICKTVFFTWV